MCVSNDVEKLKPLDIADENVKRFSYYGEQFGKSSKIKHRIIVLPSNSNPRYTSKVIKNRVLSRFLYTGGHSTLLTIAKM